MPNLLNFPTLGSKRNFSFESSRCDDNTSQKDLKAHTLKEERKRDKGSTHLTSEKFSDQREQQIIINNACMHFFSPACFCGSVICILGYSFNGMSQERLLFAVICGLLTQCQETEAELFRKRRFAYMKTRKRRTAQTGMTSNLTITLWVVYVARPHSRSRRWILCTRPLSKWSLSFFFPKASFHLI